MKSWLGKIREHVETWTRQVGPVAQYAYHFTDVRNAASIMRLGAILSRQQADALRVMVCDNASSEVIAKTRPDHLKYARLYFRPQTPTQFRNEGIRRPDQKWGDAHCPVPVFFVFDLVGLVSQDDVECSDTNMGSKYALHGADERFFCEAIDFGKVYHTGPISGDTQQVTLCRNAEILVPDRLPLNPNLRGVVCRTAAERRTLLHLLGKELAAQWEAFVTIRAGYFFNRWHFVNAVTVEPQRRVVDFEFHPAVDKPGTINVRCEIVASPSNRYAWQGPNDGGHLVLRIPAGVDVADVTLEIEGCLAYSGTASLVEAPF